MKKIITINELILLILSIIAGYFINGNISLSVAPWILITCMTIFVETHREIKDIIKTIAVFLIIAIIRFDYNFPWGLDLVMHQTLIYIFWCIPFLIEQLIGGRIKNKYLHLFFFPAVLTVYEFVFALKASSLNSFATSQFDELILAQIASVTGVFGISFLMGLFANFVAEIVKNDFNLEKNKKIIAIVVPIFLIVIIFGSYKISFDKQSDETIRVAFSTWRVDEEGDKGFDDAVELITKDAIVSGEELGGCEILFWTEEAFSIAESRIDEFLNIAKSIAKSNKVNLYLPIKLTQEGDKFQNAIYYINANGELGHRYIKNNPVPGVETAYEYAEDKIYIEKINDTMTADVVCYDSFFDRWLRTKLKDKTDLLLIPSYDPVFSESFSTPTTMFRAIELGTNAIRLTGSGRCMVFDVNGKTLTNVRNLSLNKQGVYYNDIPAKGYPTIYAKYGDWFIALCAIYILISLVFAVMKKREA